MNWNDLKDVKFNEKNPHQLDKRWKLKHLDLNFKRDATKSGVKLALTTHEKIDKFLAFDLSYHNVSIVEHLAWVNRNKLTKNKGQFLKGCLVIKMNVTIIGENFPTVALKNNRITIDSIRPGTELPTQVKIGETSFVNNAKMSRHFKVIDFVSQEYGRRSIKTYEKPLLPK